MEQGAEPFSAVFPPLTTADAEFEWLSAWSIVRQALVTQGFPRCAVLAELV
jgi:hypothetical protein